MTTSNVFKSYIEAQAFYTTLEGDCSLASSKKLGGWVVQYEEANIMPMIEQVYNALKANIENNNMVCLDNISLRALGITPKQFSGYCSQLAQQGRYYSQDDWNGWGEVK